MLIVLKLYLTSNTMLPFTNKIGETFYEQIWVGKGGAEEVSEMHGPRKSTCMQCCFGLEIPGFLSFSYSY